MKETNALLCLIALATLTLEGALVFRLKPLVSLLSSIVLVTFVVVLA